jgi:hypothetical protein
LDLAIGVPLRNREALTNLLEQLYDPSRPNYHRYLTQSSFRKDLAHRRGLPGSYRLCEVQPPIRNGHTSESHVARGEWIGRRCRAGIPAKAARLIATPPSRVLSIPRMVEPSADARVPILSVAGLDDFFLPRPMDLRTGFMPIGKTAVASQRRQSIPPPRRKPNQR